MKTEAVKGMTFDEARQKIAEIAGPLYHSIKFELNVHAAGRFNNGHTSEVNCCLYLEGKTHVHGTTWEEAFKALDGIDSPPDLATLAPTGPPCDACGAPVPDGDNVGHECDLHSGCVEVEA